MQQTLRELGYDVSWIANRELPMDYHGTRSKLKILRRIYFILFFQQIRYLKRELKKYKEIRFDIIFSINCHVICPYLFRELRRRNPEIRSILFLWDSLTMYSWEKEIRYFNEVYTFDPVDSKKLKIRYKPNFFIKRKETQNNKEYDIFFAGKFNYYRLLIIEKLIIKFDNAGIKSFIKLWPAYKIFLHNVLIYTTLKKLKTSYLWIKKYINNYEAVTGILERPFIVRNKLAYDVIQNYASCSNVILDLSFEEQSGYSHRLIDALANGKKILTTNAAIMSEEFYNSEQMKILKSADSDIDVSWVIAKSTFNVPKYIKELELTLWLKSILNVEFS
jgi:hypothetical protein